MKELWAKMNKTHVAIAVFVATTLFWNIVGTIR